MRREKPSQTPKFSPSASTHFLGCAPKFLSELSQTARGNSPGVSPRPSFYISANPGRGLGRDVATLPPLPNAPKRRVVAARRASSQGMEGVGGATPTFEGFSPHILHRRFQLKVHTNSDRNKSKFSAQQRQYSFSGLCGERTISNAEVPLLASPHSLAVRRDFFSELS